jgi:regulator of cell morphogenesis and NO signaling
MFDRNWPVATIVLDHPACALVLQKHRIDFCCAGELTLEAACAARSLDPDAVLGELRTAIAEATAARSRSGRSDLRSLPTPALVGLIVDTHHAYLRRVFPSLVMLAGKVARVHGTREPRLRALASAVDELVGVLGPHLDHEEQVLFPSLLDGNTSAPATAVALEDMTRDHHAVARLLDRIDEGSAGFSAPEWACNSYRALIDQLRALDIDLRQHVHLENHVLRPRFVAV